MAIKLVAIDIDGTLLNEKREISPKVKETIAQAVAKGVHIVLCTGRPLPGVAEMLKELELFNPTDHVITYNGALLQHTESGEILAQHGISNEQYREIEYMARTVGSHFHAIDRERIYTANRDISPYTIHESFLVSMPIAYRTVEEMTPEIQLVKTMMIDEPEILDAAIAKIPAWFREKYTTVKSSPFYYEVLSKDASKGAALKNLTELLGLTPHEVMAIGDNENDLSMISYAGIGVAMENAVPIVKSVANVMTTSNDEDGVAKAIQTYILNK